MDCIVHGIAELDMTERLTLTPALQADSLPTELWGNEKEIHFTLWPALCLGVCVSKNTFVKSFTPAAPSVPWCLILLSSYIFGAVDNPLNRVPICFFYGTAISLDQAHTEGTEVSISGSGSFLVVGAILCIQGCLAASTHYMPAAPSPVVTKNHCLQTLPHVSVWGVQKHILSED